MTEPITDHAEPELDEGGNDGATVHVSIYHGDETYHDMNAGITTEDASEVAEALIQCLRGVAAACGPELQVQLAARMGELR